MMSLSLGAIFCTQSDRFSPSNEFPSTIVQASIHYTISQISLLNDDNMQKNDLISVKVYTIEGTDIHYIYY